jgi:phosphatidylglycerophosphatase A
MSFARFLATLGPVGSAPFAPATVCSAVVAAIGWFLPVPPLFVTLLLLAAGTGVAIWACDQAEKTLGHDAKPIVIDEVIGQSIALLFVPHTLVAFAAAFFLFRLFDVWKPLGAHQLQRLVESPPAAVAGGSAASAPNEVRPVETRSARRANASGSTAPSGARGSTLPRLSTRE